MEILPFKSELKKDCITVFNSNIPKYFATHELEEFTTWLDTGQTDTYYVVKTDGQIVGCGGIYLDPQNNKAGFAWGMIHQDFHNKGLGKAFSEFRVKKIKELSDLPIFL
ncbi:MAG: GNAT family N-acetyltransferase, partial [Crocinitomicaceae bacterium]